MLNLKQLLTMKQIMYNYFFFINSILIYYWKLLTIYEFKIPELF